MLGSTEFINKAIKVRKLLGGGMRQAGYLAACGIYALKNNIERLNEDHIKAKEIESVLKNSNFISQVEKVETNILIFQIEKSIDTDNFLNKMSNQNIKLISMGDNKLRLVTHKDYTNQMHEKFLEIISKLKF